MKHLIGKAALAVLALAAITPAHAVVVGTSDGASAASGNPFGSNAGNAGYYYQQIYSGSSIGSAIDISKISFYDTTSPGTAATGNYKVWLSTSSEAIPTFDTSNIPYGDIPGYTQVFSGALPTLANGRLDLTLSSTFHYDPTAGSLLLTIQNTDLAGAGATAFFDVDKNNPVTNSRISAFPYDFNQGLVTGFNDPAPVPLPAAIWLLGSGLAGLGVFRRKKVA